jgi:hypothetical protein
MDPGAEEITTEETQDVASTVSAAFEEHEQKDQAVEDSEVAQAGQVEPTKTAKKGKDPIGEHTASTERVPEHVDEPERVPGEATVAEPKLSAPGTWKAGARERWADLPVEVQREVTRREREISKMFSDTAEARKGHAAFQEAVRPFEAMIRSEGADPLSAVNEMLRFSGALRTAPGDTKAAMIAALVHRFGVPVDRLDAHLAGMIGGQAVAPGAPTPQEFRDPRVDQLIARAQAAERERDGQYTRVAEEKVGKFAESHEFFDDVVEDMEMIYENRLRKNPGVEPDLETVYAQAVQMNSEIAQIVAQRKQASAMVGDQSVRRSKVAGKSVRSEPTHSARGNETRSIRDEVEAIYSQYE